MARPTDPMLERRRGDHSPRQRPSRQWSRRLRTRRPPISRSPRTPQPPDRASGARVSHAVRIIARAVARDAAFANLTLPERPACRMVTEGDVSSARIAVLTYGR
jgi:hypothetical protein